MQHHFVTIEGNIGSGKTTLARMLADHYQSRLILEAFADNPFLPAFYKDQEKSAFPLELFFLAERYQQLKKAITPDLFIENTISDYLFIKSLLFAKINLSGDERALYERLFHIIYPRLPQPDLLVYLHVPLKQLLINIKKRDRAYEQDIQPQYLEKLQTTYLSYIRNQADNVLLIDLGFADFEHHPSTFQKIIDAIEHKRDAGLDNLILD